MPGRKKPGPPPMMSRESSKKNWACARPAPASNVSAANSKAKARVIFSSSRQNLHMQETGHNCGDRARNERGSRAIFEHRREKSQHALGDVRIDPLNL